MRQIVLIDDDRDDAELFKEALSEIDSSIGFTHFEESKEALQTLSESNNTLPNFIFLDINMPVVSGWECLAEFKKNEHLKLIPVIMFTTSSTKRNRNSKRTGCLWLYNQTE